MDLELNVQLRKELGTRAARRLRKKNLIPGVVYGYKIENIPIFVDYKELEKVYKVAGKTTLIDLIVDNQKRKVLLYDFSKNPVTGKFISIDFYQPRLDKKIRATVPLNFAGVSEAVKNLNGVLVKNFYEVEVEALPLDLPHKIEVDISKLKTFEDSIKISDLILPKGVDILENKDEIVALVVPPRSEEELKELEEEVVEKVEEVEVVKKEKKEEKEPEESKEESIEEEQK